MKGKKNYSKWRLISLCAVYLLMGLHIAHWKIYGKTLAPLEFNEVLHTLHQGIITAGFIFMGATLIGTLIVGRFFCSWMCHIVALQDASAWLLSKLNIKPRHIRSRLFYLIPFFVAIYLFILPQLEKIYTGASQEGIRVLTDKQGWASFTTTNYWRNLPGIGITLLTFFVCGFLIIYFLGSRSFCQYACPYGAIFSIADRIAPGKIILSGNCNQCGLCTAACNSHILVHKEVSRFGKVVNHHCLKDLDCVQACPNDALSFGFTKPSGFKSLPEKERTKFDFSKREDILAGLSFITYATIFRGLYDSIPFLLSIAIAIILAFCTVYAVRLFSQEFVRINESILKHSNQFTRQGRWYLTFFILMLVMIVHSGFIHYHNYSGDLKYKKIVSMTESGFSNGQLKTITPLVADAIRHLETAAHYGIYSPASLNRQLASLYLTAGKIPEAKDHLNRLLKELPDDYEARLRFAGILNREGSDKEAIEQLQNIAKGSDGETPADQLLRSDAFLQLAKLSEKSRDLRAALGWYNRSLKENPANAEALQASGILLIRMNKLHEAEIRLLNAQKYYSNSPLLENNLSLLYLRLKNYDKALVHLYRLLSLQKGNTEIQYNIAMAWFAKGEKEKSIKLLNEILLQHPDHRNSMIALDLVSKNKLDIISASK